MGIIIHQCFCTGVEFHQSHRTLHHHPPMFLHWRGIPPITWHLTSSSTNVSALAWNSTNLIAPYIIIHHWFCTGVEFHQSHRTLHHHPPMVLHWRGIPPITSHLTSSSTNVSELAWNSTNHIAPYIITRQCFCTGVEFHQSHLTLHHHPPMFLNWRGIPPITSHLTSSPTNVSALAWNSTNHMAPYIIIHQCF